MLFSYPVFGSVCFIRCHAIKSYLLYGRCGLWSQVEMALVNIVSASAAFPAVPSCGHDLVFFASLSLYESVLI